MIDYRKRKVSRRREWKRGRGLLNSIINKLPFELHLPGYQYCGPGTKLQQRLARGDPGVNPLDKACKDHDIAYSVTQDIKQRNIADLQLAESAWNRVKAADSKVGERVNAWFVTNIMKAKAKMGMGLKVNNTKKKTKRSPPVKRNILRSLISRAKCNVIDGKSNNLKNAAKIALTAAKDSVKKKKLSRELMKGTRVIPIPKSGGVLPFLIPLFAGLSALGTMSGGAAAIVKAVNSATQARKQLDESQRHNKTMEAIAIGKGIYLKPYRRGLGLYLKTKNF